MAGVSPQLGGYLSLVGGFLLHLTLGTLYCFGNMNTYMTSYLRTHVQGQEHMLYSDAVWIPTLSTLAQGFFMTLSGHLEERIGVRMTVLLGSCLMTSGVFLTYFTIQHSLLMTTLTYGLMFGLGTALAYAPPMAVAMKWFPRKKGLVNGIIVGGFGMGAFVFNTVQTSYLNPDNHSPGADGYFTASQGDVLERVPSVFLLLGTMYGVMQLVAVLLISSPSEEDLLSSIPLVDHHVEEQEEDVIYEAEESGSALPSPVVSLPCHPDVENVSPSQVVKTQEFWMLWFTFVLNTQAVGYINTMYKAFGQQFIKDDHFLAVVGAFAAVFNSFGRVFWGHLCDAFSYKMCMMIVTIAISFLFSTLYLTEYGSRATFAIWIWAIFFAFCGNFVLLPTAAAQCFGTANSSKNYGLIMTGNAASAPILAILTQGLSPVLGYLGMFIIIACVSVVSAVLTMFFPDRPSPRKILAKLEPTTGQPTDL